MKKVILLLSSILAVFASSCIAIIEPSADIEVSKNPVSTYEEVKFFNSSHHAEEYEWDFGDGSISNEFEPVHYYSNPGRYSVKLSAYYHNMVDYTYITIDVIAPPTVLNIQVLETGTKLPVTGASILVYQTYQDWVNETNSLSEIFTDSHGIAIIEGLEPGYYYLDVWEQNHNNYALAKENVSYIKTPYLLNKATTYFTAWVDYVSSNTKSKTIRRTSSKESSQKILLTDNSLVK